MTDTPNGIESVLEFLELFKGRRALCQDLLELSCHQMNLIDADDFTQLLVVLGRKQRLLGRLDELQQHHPHYLKRWRTQRETFDRTLRDDCEHVLAETESILAELIQEENASTRHLSKRRDATRDQLQAISKGTQVHQAYRDSLAPATHRHLDVDQ